MQDLRRIRSWLRERFPRHPNVYFGVSGTTLLFEALQFEPRTSIIFPGFICPSLPAMALKAGKSVFHVDADPLTLHPKTTAFETFLAHHDASHGAVLLDHSFGYPYPDIARLRKRFPELLIVEDCARALGLSIHGQFPGEHADWVLLSMYKTITGPRNGALLLTKTPLALQEHLSVPVTIRERVAAIRPLRFFYDLAQRRRLGFLPPPCGLKSPDWIPQYGFPGRLCLARFAAELDRFETRSVARSLSAAELVEKLSRIDGLECIRAAESCQLPGHFVSFKMRNRVDRDRTLALLQRNGLFLSRTWDLLPFNYAILAETFPYGHAGSRELWDRIAHIPVRLFLDATRRRRLIEILTSRSRFLNQT